MAAKDWLGITEKTLKASDDLTEESLKDLRRSLDRSFAKISRDMVRVYKDLEGADPVYIQAQLSKIKQANLARQILSPTEAARFEQEFQQLLEQQTAEGLKYGDLMVQATSNPPELIQQFGVVNVEAAAKEARDARQYLQKYSNEAANKIIGAVSDNLLRGGSVASLSRDLRGILGTTKAHADTMAQNETLRSLNTAARDRYKDYGVQYVQILALVDKVTTPWCRYRHMKIISIKEKMPPYHHRCRTVTAPVDPSWLSKEDLKWMANESARAKNLGLSSPGKAPFDDGKMNFITPSTFAKKETMLTKAEKPQAIAPVVEKKAKARVKPAEASQETIQEKYKNTLKKEEDSIRSLPFETGIAINKKTGDVLFRQAGEKSEVPLSFDQLKSMVKDTVFTHNHPSWLTDKDHRALGNSFSDADLFVQMVWTIEEMRAVTGAQSFSMVFNDFDKEIDESRLGYSFNSRRDLAQKTYIAAKKDINKTINDSIREMRLAKAIPENANEEINSIYHWAVSAKYAEKLRRKKIDVVFKTEESKEDQLERERLAKKYGIKINKVAVNGKKA